MGLFDFFKKKEYGEQLKEQMPVQPEEPVNMQTATIVSGDTLFRIDDVFVITGRGTVVTGEVISGTIGINDIVRIQETGVQTQVTGIEMFRKQCSVAYPGDKVGVLLRGISRDDVSAGYTLVK